MKITEMPLESLREALWNSNRMDEAMLSRLRESIRRYGMITNLVVRPLEDGLYEVIGGNMRLNVLTELGFTSAPCVVVDLDDANARLLAQALNRIQGEDDLGIRAELMRKVLEDIPASAVLELLPETAESLKSLASLGKDTIAGYLENWQQAQAVRLRHLQFQLTPAQLDVVEEALKRMFPMLNGVPEGNPNARGNALYLLCKAYLEKERLV